MIYEVFAWVGNFTVSIISALSYPGVVILMALESACIPVPSEIIMPFSGYLVAMGKFSLWLVVLAGTLGDIIGSLISYLVARRMSHKLQASNDFKRAENWYKRFGAASLFLGKLVPLIRGFIAFPAGIFKVKLWKFLLLIASGALLWSILLTYIGFILGGNWTTIEPYFRKFDFVIIAILALGLIWWLRHRFSRPHKTRHQL